MTANSENAFEMLQRRQSAQSAVSEESFSDFADERTGVRFDKILSGDNEIISKFLFSNFSTKYTVKEGNFFDTEYYLALTCQWHCLYFI